MQYGFPATTWGEQDAICRSTQMAFPARDYTESLVRPGPQPSVLIGRDWLALFKSGFEGSCSNPYPVSRLQTLIYFKDSFCLVNECYCFV